MKKDLLKRIDEAEAKAGQKKSEAMRRLVSKMTTEELEELVYDDPTEERIQEIVERAKKR